LFLVARAGWREPPKAALLEPRHAAHASDDERRINRNIRFTSVDFHAYKRINLFRVI
jgi:hypothetical protein